MTDFVIIGGGVYGAATAWLLSTAGAEVCVLEARSVANRASGGPGQRGVRANGRDVRELTLMRRAYEIWPPLSERLEVEPLYKRTGQLLVAETEAEVEQAKAQCWLQQNQGIDSEWLDQSAVRDREPNVSEAILGAIYCPNDGVANHAATTRAYAAAARRSGAVVSENTVATELESHGDRITAVRTTTGERFEASQGVLVLANSAVQSLLSNWLTLPVWNGVFQVLISTPLAEMPFHHLVGHMSRPVSLKPEAGSRIMISGGWPGVWNSEAQEGYPVQASIEGNVAEAVRVFPGLQGLNVETADASHQESLSIDGIPIIDRVDEFANLYYATGWCGHGWAIAPAVAELLAQWAQEGDKPKALEPFSYTRFMV